MKQLTACFLFSTMLLTACVSTENVELYSVQSSDTLASVTTIANDFYASCLRTNAYKPLIDKDNCVDERGAQKVLLSVVAVLTAYNSALESLASDQTVDYSKPLDLLTDEINTLDAFDSAKVDALGSLAKLISSAASDQYRQAQLTEFILKSNNDVIVVCKGLASVIENNYTKVIMSELAIWELGFRELEKTSRSQNPLGWQLYAQDQWLLHAELDKKFAAAKSLATAVVDIGRTHERLALEANDLSGTEVSAAVRSYISLAKPVIKEVNRAF